MTSNALYLLQVTANLSVAALLAVGVLGLARFRSLPPGLRYLVGLVWFGLGVELVSWLLKWRHQPNLLLIPLDAAGELWLLSLVYGQAIQAKSYRRVRPWAAAGFALAAALSSGLRPEAARFSPFIQVVQCLLVLGMVAWYFHELLNELRVHNLSHDPMFWLSAGLLLYLLGKLQIVLFSNYMLDHYSRQLSLTAWTIHALLALVLYCCYGLALWIRPQK